MTTWAVLAGAVAVGAGVTLGESRPGWGLHFVALGVWALSAAGLIAPHRTAAVGAVALALFAAGAADAALRVGAESDRVLPVMARDERHVRVCGTVTERRPRSAALDVRDVRAGPRSWHTAEPLRVGGDEARRVLPGERVCASGLVLPPRAGRREPPFMAADDLERRGIASPVRYAAGVVRARFAAAAEAALPPTQAGLLLGMTDGDVALLDDRTTEDFRTTGMAHLVAVSGSNVAVVLAVAMLAARAVLRRGRMARVAIALPPLVFFAFLTGLEPSVLRAVVTAGIVVAVAASGRTADAVRAAAVAFTVLVLASPALLRRPGFQLSFAATLGLVLWALPLTERLRRLWPRAPGPLVTATAAAVATTVAAQLAVAPLLAVHFGRIPALGGVANLLVAPLAPVVMLGGMVTLTAASLSDALAWAPASLRLVCDAILWTARTFARLPAASVAVDVAAAAALTSLLAAVATPARRFRWWAVGATVAFAAAATAGGMVRSQTACDGPLLRALDVGQGTAVLAQDGPHAVLIDGGPRDGNITAELERAGVGSIDALFLSHPHADHVDGFVDVLERLEVGRVVGPVTMGWGVGVRVMEAARAAGVPLQTTVAGDIFRFGTGITIEVISPADGPTPERSEETVNAYSLVLRVRAGSVNAILPGDVGAQTQAELTVADLQANVLVAPHHGSADVHPGFVEAVDPRLTVVTVGENRYGHPTQRALRLFQRHGRVLRTDRHGAVEVCSRPEAVEVTTGR